MKRAEKILFIALIITTPLVHCRARAQEITVRSKLDTTSIFTGDHIYFTVTLEKPSETAAVLHQYSDTLISGIEILNGPSADTTILTDGRVAVINRYLITSFDSGRYEIPPVFAEIPFEEGIKRFYSDFVYLTVRRPNIAPADSTLQYFDIIGPYKVPVTVGEILPWVLILMAIGTLLWFGIRYIRNRKKQMVDTTPEEPVEAAYILAYRSLEKLKNEKLWQRGLYKDYFSALSDILRVYIDRRFTMNSMESTTIEIMQELRNEKNLNGEPYDRLKQVLELADMVKFAKLIPDSSDCELSLEHSWSFVSLTRKEKTLTENNDAEESITNDKKEEAV
jgi:hypothetical protein